MSVERKGVDISEMNGSVDFSALKAAGVEFVILRCGYGSDWPGQQDKRFAENIAKAEAAGLPWGAYLYGYARDAAGGKAEAAHALRLLNSRKPACGVWYDMEDASTLGGDLAGAAEAFCESMTNAGLLCGVYANLNWWNNYLIDPIFDRWEKWVAQYNAVCQYRKPYGMWQYTDSWVIGGRNFDGNICYKDYVNQEGEDDMTDQEFDQLMDSWLARQAKKPVSWGSEAIAYCKEHGLMVGDKDGSFRPKSPITREEAAQLAANLYKSLKNR